MDFFTDNQVTICWCNCRLLPWRFRTGRGKETQASGELSHCLSLLHTLALMELMPASVLTESPKCFEVQLG